MAGETPAYVTPAQAVAKATGHAMGCECEGCLDLRRRRTPGATWFVHYVCCGREWHEPQRFDSWDAADQHREWYVETPVDGHDRTAIVNDSPATFGWPA